MISHVLPTYNRAPIAFERGEGAWAIATDGTRYLDLGAGIAVNALGHANPELVAALTAQAGRIWHVSNLYQIPEQEKLAELLVANTFADTAFITNSGTEAAELAIKMVRKYWDEMSDPERIEILTFEGAFHGRSTGAIAAAGSEKMVKGFGPLMPGFTTLPWGDRTALRAALTDQTCAVIVEPIQGEAGVIVPPPGYLKALREICDEYGVVLIFDEIQTGMARTGTIWRCEAEGVTPDILTYGKAFGGGVMPITGIICRPHLWTQQLVDNPWLLGSPTFGGNPVCAAAALATIKYMLDNDIAGECRRKGELMKNGLNEILAKYPDLVSDVRGTGLMLAIEFVKTEVGYAVAKGLFSRGVMTAGTLVNAKSIRIQPPAVISEEQIATVLEHMDAALMDVRTKGY